MKINYSVLLSIYLKEKKEFLHHSLKSLYEQTSKASEIVIVFDGKITQELETEISFWEDKLPIKIVRLPENVGLGKALNEGLKHCSNEWIFRMDTDDICLSDRFERQVAYIRQNPDVCLLGGQIVEFDETPDRIIGKRNVPTNDAEIKKYAVTRNPFNHMTVAYKKDIIRAVGGYQHHLYMEDYNLWLRVIAEGYRVANLPDTLVNVRSGFAMYQRRSGFKYIKSEILLAKLKVQLKLQSLPSACLSALVRIIPRLLPSQLLGKIYKILRK